MNSLEALGQELLEELRPYHERREVFSGLFPQPFRNSVSHVTPFGTRDPLVFRHPRTRIPFLAPEQTGQLDQPLGPEADLYNWGATVCYAASGKPPIEVNSSTNPFRQILDGVPDLSWASGPGWPRSLKPFLETVLKKNPVDRYRSLEGLEHDWNQVWNSVAWGVVEAPLLRSRDVPQLFVPPTQLLGREEILSRLAEAAERVRSRLGPTLVQLSGEEGLGKTRLLRSSAEQLALENEGWFFLDGSADRSTPYGALRGLLLQILAHSVWEQESFRERLFASLIEDSGEKASVLSRLVPAWEAWAGPENGEEMGDSRALKTRLDFAWVALLRAWLKHVLLVLLLDDADSLGRETLDILELVVSSSSGNRLACFATTSSASATGLGHLPAFGKERQIRLEVQPLAVSALHSMVSALPAHPEQREELVALIASKTQGIPRSLDYFWENLKTFDAVRPDVESKCWLFNLEFIRTLQIPESSLGWFRVRLASLEPQSLRALSLLILFPAGLPHGQLKEAIPFVFGPQHEVNEEILNQLVRDGWIVREPHWKLASRSLENAIEEFIGPLSWGELLESLANYRLATGAPEDAEDIHILFRSLESFVPAKRLAYIPVILACAGNLIRQSAYSKAWSLVNLISPEAYVQHAPDTQAVLNVMKIAALAGQSDAFLALVSLLNEAPPAGLDRIEIDYAITRGWLNLGALGESLDAGLSLLDRQGIRLPYQPKLLDVVVGTLPLQLALRSLSLEQLLARHAAQGRSSLLILEVIQILSTAAFFHRPLLIPILTAKNILFGLKAGLSAGLGVSFATLAFQQAVIFKNPGQASRTLIWAEEILKKYPSREAQVRVDFLAWSFVRWWDLPLVGVGSALLENSRTALALGLNDTGFSSFVIGVYYELWGGQELSTVQRHIEEKTRTMELQGNTQNLMLLKGVQAFLAYQSGGDREQFEAFRGTLVGHREKKVWTTYFSLGGLVLLMDLLDGSVLNAVEIAETLLAKLSMVGLATYTYPIILVLATVFGLLDGGLKPRSKIVRKVKRLLKRFEKKGAVSFLAHQNLLDSAIACHNKKFAEAHWLATIAIDRFSQENQTLMVALALEVRARILDEQNLAELARRDWKATYWTWRELGYLRHSALLATTRSYLSPVSGNSAEVGSRLAALESFANASLQLMQQPSRDALAVKVEELFGEGGQERIRVLILNGQVWQQLGSVKQKLEKKQAPLLLLHRAWDQQELIVVDGRGLEKIPDPYLKGHRGSLAILPLVREKRTQALVFLEHPVLTGAFPDRRIEALRPLAAQAAAAFESRSLLEEMEARASSRNADLVKERDRAEALLLNILPRAAAEELKNTGRTRAKTYHGVTVMFLDFVNFTSGAAKMEAQDLVDLIDEYFSGFDRIMDQWGLEKIKTMGDAYMAVAGLPEGGALAAPLAVEAALAMLQFVAQVGQKRQDRGLMGFQARVGLHTGPVVAGVVGTRKFQFDIWGDTVNVAARLEQNSEPGRINLSEATWNLVKNRFKTRPRGKILAKNKGEIEMYFVEE
jgi:class 3 adenylate cyclase